MSQPDELLPVENVRLLRGRGQFVDDVHLDRMLEGAFVRSPLAHAWIRSIDASAAIAGGAALVLTADDLPFRDHPYVVRAWHACIRGSYPSRVLATDKVRYVGEPVAFVVADSRYRAEDLAALVEVDYEPLPPVGDVVEAQQPGAAQLHSEWPDNVAATLDYHRGQAIKAMAASKRRLRHRFCWPRVVGNPLETRGCVAKFDREQNALTVWVSTQYHYIVRQNLAAMLDLPEENIRVIAEDVGGGFGTKSRPYAEEIVASHASRVLNAPVKWIEDRLEHMQATTHARATDVDIEVGYGDDGQITALEVEFCVDVGAYVFTSGIATAEVAAAQVSGPYIVPNLTVRIKCIGTNRTPLATFRGAGQPEATFPMECLLDLVAKDVGLSSAELRRRNLVKPADLPYASFVRPERKVIFESGDFPAMLERGATESGYTETVTTLASGERVAWGLACGIEGAGYVNFESALVRVDAAGNVQVLSGMSSQGQGQRTTYAKVCAETLGVDVSRVSVRMGDTSYRPFGRGAFASRGAIFGGNAVFIATQKLKAKILAGAATLLQCSPDQLDLHAGRILRDGEPTSLSIGDIAAAVRPGGTLFDGEAALEAAHVFKADQLVTFGMTMQVAQVAVYPETGFVRILDLVVIHDAGRILDHRIAQGQVVGSAAEGVGGALFSEVVYDEQAQLLTGTLADYMVLMAGEAPRIRTIELETRPTTNPLGVRGIGECGTIPAAPAIVNAVARAVESAAGCREPLFALPLKPERVLSAFERDHQLPTQRSTP
ncbi:MAG: xanthine dehydrogenase family protein molybdopterin-binding subunit [Pseudolabrys sp.]